MGKKEDAIAGLNALTDTNRTIENVKLILTHYGFDSYDRKSKVLEDLLNIHRDWDNIDRKTRFEMLAQYFIEQKGNKKAPKTEKKSKPEFIGSKDIHVIKMPFDKDDVEGTARSIASMIGDIISKKIKEQEEAEDNKEEVEGETMIDEIVELLNDFDADELEDVRDAIIEYRKKVKREKSPAEKAAEAYINFCNRFNLDEDDDANKLLFFAGMKFAEGDK